MKRSPPGKPTTNLPGLHKVIKPLANGRFRLHVYVCRGGRSIGSFEGKTRAELFRHLEDPAIAAELASNYAAQTTSAKKTETLADLLHKYEASEAFRRKSYSTKYRERGPLEEIRQSKLGSLPLKAISAKRTKSVIKKWRQEIGEKQGTCAADTRVGLLSKAFNWGIEEAIVDHNPAARIEKLHYADRSDVIFTPDDIQRFEAAARKRYQNVPEEIGGSPSSPPCVALALRLVCYGGFRREDLCNLTWQDVRPHSIAYKPLKSLRRARTARKPKKAPIAVVPITTELRAVLEQCDPGESKRGPWVLTNSYGNQFTPSGLTTSFSKVRDDANIVDDEGRKKCLHDGRGTFVTHMRASGERIDDIAEMVGWSTTEVERIAKKYIDGDRVAQARIEQLEKRGQSGAGG